MAGDYFQFVTKFFEVIKASATHIYHSALELSPMSSIVRKLYHHRCVTHLPRVVIGTPESWTHSIAIFREEEDNRPYTWSLCGRFVAAVTRRAVEIRNQLTLELITILQPPETIPHLTGPVAYSPDGRSIACASYTAIIIWDIQTGGVAKEIECGTSNHSLVWSSDGQRICTIGYEPYTVHIYGVSSGAASSPGTLQSRGSLHLWAVDESFRVMTTYDRYDIKTIDIFEVGSTLTKIQSFSPRLSSTIYGMSFSPTTHHISFWGYDTLSISDVRSSEVLLHAEHDNASPRCFSSDGSFFAASKEEILSVWKYDSGHYALCGKYQLQDWPGDHLLFSPTPSSSIMGQSWNTLWVLHLHELPTAPKIHRQQYVGLSRSGTRVATAHGMESTVTTADVLARTPPHTGDKGPNTHWVHGENIEITVNM